MATFEHRVDITLAVQRCYNCGRYWAHENAVSGTCPTCAQDKIERLVNDVTRHERAAASLRGALTKAKRRNK
jgi:predicted RNA-binding Zn-ribbon protein involved in translation (DUF1610 family)